MRLDVSKTFFTPWELKIDTDRFNYLGENEAGYIEHRNTFTSMQYDIKRTIVFDVQSEVYEAIFGYIKCKSKIKKLEDSLLWIQMP